MSMDGIGNGDKAWALLMSKIDSISHNVGDLTEGVEALRREAAVYHARIDGLKCGYHQDRLERIERTIDNRLSWRALLTAVVPALVAGAIVGGKIL